MVAVGVGMCEYKQMVTRAGTLKNSCNDTIVRYLYSKSKNNHLSFIPFTMSRLLHSVEYSNILTYVGWPSLCYVIISPISCVISVKNSATASTEIYLDRKEATS